ncbi:MAG: hypothetical protein IJA17_10355 [Oscillospiraceae bacterium]|nr:hypothetical protein [Oscillospiraceae bacterium]
MKDYELVNEMLKPALKKDDRAGYPVLTEDHFFFQAVIDFMSDKRIWLGTASDLVSDMNCGLYANTAAKLLRKYGNTALKKEGLVLRFIRTNKKRLIEIRSKK